MFGGEFGPMVYSTLPRGSCKYRQRAYLATPHFVGDMCSNHLLPMALCCAVHARAVFAGGAVWKWVLVHDAHTMPLATFPSQATRVGVAYLSWCALAAVSHAQWSL